MKILIVISNFNESGVIEKTIRDVSLNCPFEADILIIDNASTDNSIEIIKNHKVDYLIHPANTGGSAGVIKTAIKYAYLNNYDIYCHMDGDNQHNASELGKLIEPIFNESIDIVIGSRFIKSVGFQSTFFRRIAIQIFSRILTFITKSKLTDITSGFRAYNKKAMEYFELKYKHEFEASVQMLLIAAFAQLKISEVPVIMKPRTTGRSEVNIFNALKFPIYGTINLIGTLIQKH